MCGFDVYDAMKRQIKTPVLFLVFNRPDTTAMVLKSIRHAAPPRLYVAGDGPRTHIAGEDARVKCTRELVIDGIDWPCEVFTRFQENNLGCKHAVSGAINWFFEHEDQGIILEDDCLPHLSFFNYCEEMLIRYANDRRIWHIGANNYQNGIWRGDGDYYFSYNMHIWGWATWKNRWQHYDINMQGLERFLANRELDWVFIKSENRNMWRKQFNWIAEGLDTWDIQWQYTIWKNGGMVITPNVNLVTNIGFGPDATHTYDNSSRLANREVGPLNISRHPTKIMVDQQADVIEFMAYRRKPALVHRIYFRLRKLLYALIRKN